MKNLFRFTAVVAMAVIFNQITWAQDQTVAPGSTFNYSTTGSVVGSTFTWSVAGPAAVTTSSTTASQAISWPATTGDYTITLTESANSCPDPTPSTYVVRVIATTIVISTADAAASCAVTGGSDALTVTFDRSLAGSEFPVTVNANVVIDGAAAAPVVLTVGTAGVPGNTATLTFANAQNNTALVQRTNSIVITSATTAMGGTITLGADVTYQHPINPIPSTGIITHD